MLIDLKNEDFSTKLDVEPSEIVNDLVRPLISELAGLKKPDRVLKSEVFSAKLEVEASEPLTLLKNEAF